jgi:diacylglycerol O-acyltransferase / wax synthase
MSSVAPHRQGAERVGRIERAAAADLMFLAVQGATVPEQFGAVLVLEPGDGFEVARATDILGERLRAVPRMRQRVMRVPPLCGRAVWVDDAAFAVERHIEHLVCPPPGDERALLDLAARLVGRPLPLDRPLWTAAFVTGLDRGRVALVVVVQHALADGVGGLAVLAALVDGAPAAAPGAFPVPPPSAWRLAADALLTRGRAVLTAPARTRAAVRSPRRPRAPRVGRAGRCSLLQVTGPRRRVAVARATLDDVRAVAHRHGATVNDVVLTAVAGALHATLDRRGEHLAEFVVAVPVAARAGATSQTVGNRFTETRAVVPGAGAPLDRLERVARIMQVSKLSAWGPSVGTIAAAAVRAAVAVGAYDGYLRRQRYLHTVVTNLRGPDRRQSLDGAPITEILPLAVGGGGNVTVTFAVLSYAGAITVTVTADPDRMPDLAMTTAALQAELDTLTAGARTP